MFWDNLVAECNRQGVKVTPMIQELGISSGNISSWKRGGNVHSDTLLSISKKLGVSVDYLLTGKRVSDSDAIYCTDRDEEMLIMMYRSLTPYQKGKCYSYVRGMYDSIEQGEKSAV